MDALTSLFRPAIWLGYLRSAAQGLLLAVPVAVLFEVAGALLRRWVLKRLGATFARGAEREPAVRARRRRALREVTVEGLRVVQNVLAVTVILTLWHVEPLAVAVVLLVLALSLHQLVQDAVAGYGLLLDDCLAPGDEVTLGDRTKGIVIEVGLRRVRLVDAAGGTWWVRASELGRVLNHSQLAHAPQNEAQP